jgi:hypothetical protein
LSLYHGFFYPVNISPLFKFVNIATLEYLLTEKVSGSMTNPMANQTIPTEMTCSYIGRHDFNIDQGRWDNVKGEFRINSSGIMNSRVL